jgi:hypothetical protein
MRPSRHKSVRLPILAALCHRRGAQRIAGIASGTIKQRYLHPRRHRPARAPRHHPGNERRSGWNFSRKPLKSCGADFLGWNTQALVPQRIADSPTGRQGATNSAVDFKGFFGENSAPHGSLSISRGNKWGNKFHGPAEPSRPPPFWFLVRRVPGEFALYDKRNPVRISTGIRILDDPRGLRAAGVVAKLDA